MVSDSSLNGRSQFNIPGKNYQKVQKFM